MSYNNLKIALSSLLKANKIDSVDKEMAEKYNSILLWKCQWAFEIYEVLMEYKQEIIDLGIEMPKFPNGQSDFPMDNGDILLSESEILYLEEYKEEAKYLGSFQSEKEVKPKPKPRLSVKSILALNWGEKKKVFLRQQDKYMYVSNISMPDGFEKYYKKSKIACNKAGIYKSKDRNGNWNMLALWQEVDEVENPQPKVQLVHPDIISIEEISKIDELKPILAVIDQSILYDYQKEHTYYLAYAIYFHGCGLDLSDTGTGKTYSNLVLAKALGLKIFVVCPKAVIPSWKRSAEKIGNEVLGIVNYELVKMGKYITYRNSKVRRMNWKTGQKETFKIAQKVPCPYITAHKIDYKAEFNRKKKGYENSHEIKWHLPKDCLLIFDEVHYCKNKGKINSLLLTSAVDSGAKIMGLSATLGESTLKLYGVSKMLGYWNNSYEYYDFLRNYDCEKVVVKRDKYGREIKAWQFRGDETTMEKFHHEIFKDGKGHRMNVNKLIAEGKFPETQLIAESYNINGKAKAVQKAYEERDRLLEELYAKRASMEDAEFERVEVAIRQKCLQIAELAKLEIIETLVAEHIQAGRSCIVFLNYRASVFVLGEVLKKKKIDGKPIMKTDSYIIGDNKGQNEVNRLRFQANEERVIICTSAGATGIDLHDEKHEFQRSVFFSPNDNAVLGKQAIGRAWRAGGTKSLQYYIYLADTKEEEVCENMANKFNMMNTLNDGENVPIQLEI